MRIRVCFVLSHTIVQVIMEVRSLSEGGLMFRATEREKERERERERERL